MSFFQKVRSVFGLGTGVESSIDKFDSIMLEEAIALHRLDLVKSEFNEISEELDYKSKACDVLIEKGNADFQLNKKVIQSKVDALTSEYLVNYQAINAELLDIRERKTEIEGEILAKAIEFTAMLPDHQQAYLKDLMGEWQETGKVSGNEIESHTLAIVKAIDEISDGFFQKAVSAQIGDVREWAGGQKWKKTNKGWVRMTEGKSGKKDEVTPEKKHSTQELMAHAENTSIDQLKKIAADESKSAHLRDAAKREIERRNEQKDTEKRHWAREDKVRAQDKESAEKEKKAEKVEAKQKEKEKAAKESEKMQKDSEKEDKEFGLQEDVAGHHVIDAKHTPGAKRHIHVVVHPKGDKYTVVVKDNKPNEDGTETITPYTPKIFDKETFDKFWESAKRQGVRRLGDSPEANAIKKKKKKKEQPVPYQPSEDLSPEQSAIEKKFGKYLNSKYKEAKTRYEAKFGNVLNTDNARELSDDYEKNRSQLSSAVHEPSSAFIKKLYSEMLAGELPKGKRNVVLFTAGGTGAGKTTGIQGTMKGDLDRAHIVYDTNMNTFESSVKKIEQALEAGKNVKIAYTFRDPVDAFENGAVPRSLRIGRTVPLEEHVKTHIGAMDTIIRLKDKYKDNKKVAISVIDNSKGAGKANLADIDFVKEKNKSYNANELREQLHKLNQGLYEQGKIPESHYKGFKGNG